jgi:GTPase SAR1 family protein
VVWTGVMEHKSTRLAIVGQAGVGKTALVNRFIAGTFLGPPPPPPSPSVHHCTMYNGVPACITAQYTMMRCAGNL